MECFRAIVEKCNNELFKTGEMINTIRYKRRFPHTGFYQKNWGAMNQVNCRTIDLIRSTQHRMRGGGGGVPAPGAGPSSYQPGSSAAAAGSVAGSYGIDNNTLLDIYNANLRFQLSVQNLVLTRTMLSTALDEFINRVAEYESMLSSGAGGASSASGAGGAGGAGGSEQAVSSTTLELPTAQHFDVTSSSATTAAGYGRNSGLSTAAVAARQRREAALSAKLSEIQNNITIIQSFLNQAPMLSCPIRMELHLMDIYDDYDDSVAVHHLLSDQHTVDTVHQIAAHLPPVFHDWNLIASEEVVRHKFHEITQNLRRNGGQPQARQQ
jgi:hypothetical protein